MPSSFKDRAIILRALPQSHRTSIHPRNQLSNHLGSAVTEVEGSGAIISYEEYHPYGTSAYRAVDASIDLSAKRYRYTGMERDEETSLEYHSARFLVPWLGRWISADPLGLVDGTNLFSYTRGNPTKLVDPGGTFAGDPESPPSLDLYPTGAHYAPGPREVQVEVPPEAICEFEAIDVDGDVSQERPAENKPLENGGPGGAPWSDVETGVYTEKEWFDANLTPELEAELEQQMLESYEQILHENDKVAQARFEDAYREEWDGLTEEQKKFYNDSFESFLKNRLKQGRKK